MEIVVNGEEITEEIVKQLIEKANEADIYKAKAEKETSEKLGLVEEIKELRVKKASEKTEVPNAQDEEAKVIEAVKKVLDQEKSTQIETIRTSFEEKFKLSNPDFTPANDPGGIKYEAFKKELSNFNLTSAKTQEDLETIYSKALTLTGLSKTNSSSAVNNYTFTPGTKSGINTISTSGLTSEEETVIKQLGWTEEKFLKLKADNPAYVKELFK